MTSCFPCGLKPVRNESNKTFSARCGWWHPAFSHDFNFLIGQRFLLPDMTEEQRKSAWFRFWSKVYFTDGCWWWTASTHKTSPRMAHKGYFPYGRIGLGSSRVIKAHRMAYMLYYGPIPDGLFVLHSCDNPRCVRPDHLKLGTHDDNMADLVRRKRSCFGERRPQSKLTDQKVLDIRRMAESGVMQKEIAEQFGVVDSVISVIVNRKAWKHI